MMMKFVLVVLISFFIACVSADSQVCDLDKQHPIVFFPGLFGSRLQEKFDIPEDVPMPSSKCPRQSDGWEPAWVEWKKNVVPEKFDCLCHRLMMVPDKEGRTWSNVEGVDVRVPYFGSVKSVDPLCEELGNVIRMYGPAMDTLQKMGFVDGKTLIVASYDWRRMPTTEWMNEVRSMIEKAVTATGKKAVIFTHSMGGPVSYIFLMSQTAEWRQKFIHHYIPVSPVWKGTCIIPFGMVTKKVFNYTGPLTSIGALFRDLEGLYVLAPSMYIDPDNTIVAKTDLYTYTARNLSMLLERVNVSNAEKITRNVQDQLYKYNYEHPGVPLTSLWTVQGPGSLGYFFWTKDSDVGVEEPVASFTDGDGLVPTDSLEYAANVWLSGPHSDITRGIPLPKSNHGSTTNHNVTMSVVFNAACDSD